MIGNYEQAKAGLKNTSLEASHISHLFLMWFYLQKEQRGPPESQFHETSFPYSHFPTFAHKHVYIPTNTIAYTHILSYYISKLLICTTKLQKAGRIQKSKTSSCPIWGLLICNTKHNIQSKVALFAKITQKSLKLIKFLASRSQLIRETNSQRRWFDDSSPSI